MRIRQLLPAASLVCLAMLVGWPVSGAQRNRRPAAPVTTDVIWQNPGAPERLDFVGGIGGRRNAPRPPFQFVEESSSGTTPKVKVRDANGRQWTAKWGSEVNSEVFASRIAWAAGYIVEPSYFVASGRIIGVGKLDRAKDYVSSDGSFRDARFEAKTESIASHKDEESWRWDQNPFLGTKELDGLKIIVMLVSNWDNKDQRDAGRGSNTCIYDVQTPSGVARKYVISDWGGSMGKWGGVLRREKWDAKGYADQSKDFLQYKSGRWQFGYSGQHTDDFKKDISPTSITWIANRLSRITDRQIRDGLTACGAAPNEIPIFAAAVRERIRQLQMVR